MASTQSAPRIAVGPTALRADPKHLSEEERVDRWRVLAAEAEKERTEGEHHHQRQRGHHVVAAAAAEKADPECSREREDAEAEQRADPNQARPGGAGEGAVGDRVGREGRAAQDGEEADHAGDHGDDAGDGPGVDHEPREHRARP